MNTRRNTPINEDNGDKSSEYSGNKTNKPTKIEHPQTIGPSLVPPDGGWGWFVVAGGFIAMMCAALPQVAFGILFSSLIMKKDVSSALNAWIFNSHGLTWNLATLLAGPFCEELGWRKVAFIGSVFSSLSVFLSAFAPNAEFLLFSFSLLGGFGSGLGAATSLFAVSRYFEKRRGFAMGLIGVGTCAGGFVSPVLASFLLQEYGYIGAALIYSGILLNNCVCAMLFQPVKWHMKVARNEVITEETGNKELLSGCSNKDEVQLKEEQLKRSQERRFSVISTYSLGSIGHSNLDDFEPSRSRSSNKMDHGSLPRKNLKLLFKKITASIYRNLATLKYFQVIIISIGIGCLFSGYLNFQMWIPFTVTDKGHSLQTAAWCMSLSSTANVLGRLILSFLVDFSKFNVGISYAVSLFCVAAFSAGFTLVTDIRYIVTLICCWGFSVGASICLLTVVMINTMGVELFPAFIGVSAIFNASFFVVFGPVIGRIRDITSSYTYAIWCISGMVFSGFLLFTLMPLAKTYDENKNKQEPPEPLEQFL